jgi:hypothetical protein
MLRSVKDLDGYAVGGYWAEDARRETEISRV